MIRSQTPALRHRTKRLSQVVCGPQPFGRSRHGAPDRKTQNIPLSTRRSYAAWLVWEHRPDDTLLMVAEFIAHDSQLRSWRALESHFRSRRQSGHGLAAAVLRVLTRSRHASNLTRESTDRSRARRKRIWL